MSELGKILKHCRKFNRMTQKELSDKMGISRPYICEIESGRKIPTLETLQKYSEVFDVPVSVLFLFAENLDNKNLKKKVKSFVRKKVIELLDYIQSF